MRAMDTVNKMDSYQENAGIVIPYNIKNYVCFTH
jgi:hypothetical protein